MEDVKKEVMEDLEEARELRASARETRADQLADRMDRIADKLGDKLESITTCLTGVDIRLNNHLKHHETLETKLMYPIAVILGAAGLAMLVRAVLQIVHP